MKISTLSCPGITTMRRDGNTTRQANFAIEKFFAGEEVLLEDHIYNTHEYIGSKNTKKLSFHLIEKVMVRLFVEHCVAKEKVKIIDKEIFSIKMI